MYASHRAIGVAKRNDLLREAQRRIADLAPEIVLYNTAKIDAGPATRQGFTGNPPNAGPFWNVPPREIAAK